MASDGGEAPDGRSNDLQDATRALLQLQNRRRMPSNYAFVKEVGFDSRRAMRSMHGCHPSLSVFEVR